MKIANTKSINDSTIAFEVYIESSDSIFKLTSYQCVLSINNVIPVHGFFYAGSSDLKEIIPSVGIGYYNSEGKTKMTFASLPGIEVITTKNTLIGKFYIKTKINQNDSIPKIHWCFDNKISTILTSVNFEDITNPQDHSDTNYVMTSIRVKLEKYSLGQNYPNPFNPTTSINFTLAEAGKVDLEVYNILGENVSTLVNQEMSAGSHEVNFNASNLASGIYIYRINVNNKFIDTKKMILMK